MKVSVIIPNYNHAKFLIQRIESVLSQTYQNFELIILDDCSGDNSWEVIERYRQHQKVSHIVYNKINSGSTFKQWKKGIELAQGEWIWIAESDDWCESTLLSTLIAGVEKDTTIAYCQSVVVYNTGRIEAGLNTKFLEAQVKGQDFVKDKMLHRNSIYNASMCIFKKSCFYNIGDDYTHYKFCGDWLFWIGISLQGKVYVSGKFLNFFRKHEKDVSGNAFKNGLFYSEWFRLIDNLEINKIIDSNTRNGLTIHKFKAFMADERIERSARNVIKQSFYKRLNFKMHVLYLRFIFSKYILEPLYLRI